MVLYGRYNGGNVTYGYLFRGLSEASNPPDASGTSSPSITSTDQQSAIGVNKPVVIPGRGKD